MFTGTEFRSLRKALDEIPIIDTHEHYGEKWDSPETTLYDIFRESYVGWTAHDGELEPGAPSLARWLEPGRYNAYTVSLLRGLSELYGTDVRQRDEGALAGLAEKVADAYQEPGWALSVLRKAGIQHSIVDPLPEPGYVHAEPSFHLALRSHMLVHGYDRSAVDHGGNNPFAFAAKFGRGISSFDDYLGWVDFWAAEHKRRGAVAIKSALAYERDIDVGPVSRREAERNLDTGTRESAGAEEVRRLHPEPAGAEGRGIWAGLSDSRRPGAASDLAPLAADVAAGQQPQHHLRPLPRGLSLDG